jgi:acyl-CoA thioesterase-1
VLLIALLGIAIASPTPATAEERTILVLGDSISAAYGIEPEQGWVQLLQDRLDAKAPGYSVVNASISGETTGGGLARLPGALERHEPEVVIVELGGNDGLRGYPITRIRDNLARMVELAQDAGARVLLVGMLIPPNYGDRYLEAFRGAFREVADDAGVPLIPFLLEGIATDDGLMQEDGIHPEAEAQPMLLENLWPALARMLEGVRD